MRRRVGAKRDLAGKESDSFFQRHGIAIRRAHLGEYADNEGVDQKVNAPFYTDNPRNLIQKWRIQECDDGKDNDDEDQ